MDHSNAKDIANHSTVDGDRFKELKAFDDGKAGVKGLVDSGITNLPRIFIRPPEDLIEEKNIGHLQVQVPVIDLSAIQGRDKSNSVIDEIRQASEEWGFFQVINHGIPQSLLDEMIDGAHRFHEQDAEVKKQYYSRDLLRMVRYFSNGDLFESSTANWNDCLAIKLTASNQVEPDELPEVCRSPVIDYASHVNKLGETLFELLSEALGLELDNLNALGCAESCYFLLHYYPPCPEPDKTQGVKRHTDFSFLTILLQDQIGGLQVLYDNQWADVPLLPGSLTVNIGDLLQIISNDRFKSAEHRVIANRIGPRVSVPCFFGGVSTPARKYGPLKELISEESPALYKEFTVPEYAQNFFSMPYDGSHRDIWKI
ncbi:1-aminocyclopropane-1-carboxylate oxidase homolog 1-like [Coffea eugenioides]|uniref:1-aminocyclopropane-1-carboxylate oxidase homolog 1-like n=1 Tax=Coffea eugenioides TaxID=49369 RepID=UPI000F60C995|nr:1-aminocyclopropane-1-carboxylate oxidase homolog 1-like [Coffea eugenioides]XP_027166178.1 1-aminocyclopropane-1-carboxylate oxidase homolog 1-like [Coffea eugenioides]